MTLQKLIVGTIAILGFSATAFAHDHNAWRDKIDMTRADLETFSMVMINAGEEAGSMTYGWHRDGNRFVLRDRTTMQPNILETAEAIMDADSLLPLSVTIDFAVGENRMDVDLRWQDGWRQGQLVSVRDGNETVRDVNIEVEDPAPLRMAVIGMVAALPLKEGFKTSLPWFNTLANRVEDVALIVTGSDEIETPAGAFDSWRVAVKGGSPENVIYVSKSAPHKITRIDVVGQPMHFVRLPNVLPTE